MARLAAERLGDTRLAIEIYNTILGEAGAATCAETLAALAGALRAREALPRARRDPASPGRARARRAQGSDRAAREARPGLRRSAAGAAAGRRGVAGDPRDRAEPRARRCARCASCTRRPATSRGSSSCTRGSARKTSSSRRCSRSPIASTPRTQRLPLVERAAQLAQKRADAAQGRQPRSALEKARQVWERVLAVEPQHVGAAARARADLREAGEVGAPAHGARDRARGARPTRRRGSRRSRRSAQLCEQKLASQDARVHVDACARSSSSRRASRCYDDVLRLASEPDQWREVVGAFERAIAGGTLPDADAAQAATASSRRSRTRRLGDPERARGYHRQVLELAPDDRDAESQPRGARDAGRRLAASCSRRIAGARARETDAAGDARRCSSRSRRCRSRSSSISTAPPRRTTRRSRALPGNLQRAARARADRGSARRLGVARRGARRGARADARRPAAVRSADAARPARGAAASSARRKALALLPRRARRPGARRRRARRRRSPRSRGSRSRPTAGDKLEPTERVAAARLVLPHLEARASSSAQQAARARGHPRGRRTSAARAASSSIAR